jgi:methylated-DNA-protein-cysteine methyltransferase-like protein
VQVYKVVRLIPYGRVTSYGAIAKCIGSPGASRMVGWALNNCHTQHDYVPAHRVVNRIGMLSGKHHFRHENLMQELLESEGVVVENNKISDFKTLFWDPSVELV